MTGAAPVQIIPLEGHAPPAETIHALSTALGDYLRVPVVLGEPIAVPRTAMTAGSLSSNVLVDALIEQFEGDKRWTLAVTSSELIAPGRDFVYGEAALGGSWAVVSSARLVDSDTPLTVDRLFKESLHELGHLAGLGHCARPACIMCRSATVHAVDAKADFCQKCVSDFFQSARS